MQKFKLKVAGGIASVYRVNLTKGGVYTVTFARGGCEIREFTSTGR